MLKIATKVSGRKPYLQQLNPAGATLGLGGTVPVVLISWGSASKPVRRLRTAVQAAIKAYAKSGHMLDAALAYAAAGFPVFPLSKNKKPVPRRDKDANGKEIPGTGGFKKSTCDPVQIHAWWDKHEYLVGMPMGEWTGVWCLDIDTSEDHADGVAQWREIAAQHEPIVTREHRSATDGPHLIFNFHADQLNGCSNGSLPSGIDVKGHGSYIVVPPSVRKKRAYTVYNNIDPVDQPQWLTELILQGRSRRSDGGDYTGQVAADFDEIAEALSFIPNNDEGWVEWNNMGLRIFAATNGEGFELFDKWSSQSCKYNLKETTLEAWERIQSCPPTRTGAEMIFKIAREHGWVRKAEPTYSTDIFADAEAARRKMEQLVHDFLSGAEGLDPFMAYGFSERGLPEPPPALAMRVTTGVGKTRIVIRKIAELLKITAAKTVIYAVDRHMLSEKIEEQFREHGIEARIFRGRSAVDPVHYDKDKPKEEQIRMCLRPEAVALALRSRAAVLETCCKKGKRKCPLLPRCGYFRQMPEKGEKVDVWIVASDMLFHSQEALGKPDFVIIDEAIWMKGIRGSVQRKKKDADEPAVAIGSLLRDGPVNFVTDDDRRDDWRNTLGRALMLQKENGGVNRSHLEETLSSKDCTEAIGLEWRLIPKIKQEPNSSDDTIMLLATSDLIDTIIHTRRVIKIWATVRELLEDYETEVSGRLTLKQSNGQRVIEWRGVAPINDQFNRSPTLMLDATLPDLPVLNVYYPQAQVVADIKVAMPPHVRIVQVLGSPTSSSKLIETGKLKDTEQHLNAVKRYVWQRWCETGRQRSLVVSQEKVEAWMQDKLPENVELEHFNNIAGLDEFKDVRLEVLIGRTMPGPTALEALAAALSGRQPQLIASNPKGYGWYPQVKRGIRLVNGKGVAVDRCDQHPDAFVESIRWQICEGELIQALGRARGINRTAENPLRHLHPLERRVAGHHR